MEVCLQTFYSATVNDLINVISININTTVVCLTYELYGMIKEHYVSVCKKITRQLSLNLVCIMYCTL